MIIDCEKLLNKIDDSIGENVLFKKYSKEELLIGLINFYYPNQKYLNDKMEAFRDNKINISDFRIIIKFIYKYAKNNELYIVKFILLYFKCFKCYIINQNRGIYGKNKISRL